MSQISFLIKPSSSLCNMACTYCFYRDEANNREQYDYGIMKNDVVEALIDQSMALNVDQINYCFQGGEPTLAGIEFFHNFVKSVDSKNNGKKVTYAIQTNGLNLNEAWYELFQKYHFLVGVSLDGFKENHDTFRLDLRNRGTFEKIIQTIENLKNYKIDYNILTVLTHQLAKYPKQLFEFYKENQIQYVQLIPCLPSLNEIENPYSLQPKDFSDFYIPLFDEWVNELKKGNYISITLFDQLLQIYSGKLPTLCGMLSRCQMQYVIESDGSCYPCDFYALDTYKCGNIVKDSLYDIFKSQTAQQFLTEKSKPTKVCGHCNFYKMCYGYCKRGGVCLKNDEYCGYQALLTHAQPTLFQLHY